MSSVIEKIQIENFRSIAVSIIPCSGGNVFSGLNDTGKSNVLRALNLFFNDQTDFLTPVSFKRDYSKVGLASAQRAGKKKQQIKVRLYLRPPSGYKSLQEEDEVWIEKIIDRENSVSYAYSNSDKRSSITRLIHSLEFFYIPALKGPIVLKHLLGRIGEQQLVPAAQLEELNQIVNTNAGDLQKILGDSRISTQTEIGMPALVSDFWEGLSVNTLYDSFDVLESTTLATKKGSKAPLDARQYQIPLENRGDGIKSTYIPPLLEWLRIHTKKTFIWAIDEPENSLEFNRAQGLAELYYDVYMSKTQIFLTTHSLAFIFPDSKNNDQINLFRCLKGARGETDIRFIDSNLFKEAQKHELAEEIGALEIQKRIMDDYRKATAELVERNSEIDKLRQGAKPLLLTEGKTDKEIIEAAAAKLGSDFCNKVDIDECKSASYLKNFINNQAITRVNRNRVVALFDCDSRGLSEFKGLKTTPSDPGAAQWERVSNCVKKRSDAEIYAILLPAPDHRQDYATIPGDADDADAQFQFLEIEHYFSDAKLRESNMIKSTIKGIAIITSGRPKGAFPQKVNTFDVVEFSKFNPLLNELSSYLLPTRSSST